MQAGSAGSSVEQHAARCGVPSHGRTPTHPRLLRGQSRPARPPGHRPCSRCTAARGTRAALAAGPAPPWQPRQTRRRRRCCRPRQCAAACAARRAANGAQMGASARTLSRQWHAQTEMHTHARRNAHACTQSGAPVIWEAPPVVLSCTAGCSGRPRARPCCGRQRRLLSVQLRLLLLQDRRQPASQLLLLLCQLALGKLRFALAALFTCLGWRRRHIAAWLLLLIC